MSEGYYSLLDNRWREKPCFMWKSIFRVGMKMYLLNTFNQSESRFIGAMYTTLTVSVHDTMDIPFVPQVLEPTFSILSSYNSEFQQWAPVQFNIHSWDWNEGMISHSISFDLLLSRLRLHLVDSEIVKNIFSEHVGRVWDLQITSYWSLSRFMSDSWPHNVIDFCVVVVRYSSSNT